MKGKIEINCWDNEGKTADRYTIAISGLMLVPDRDGKLVSYTYFLVSSCDPFYPQGVGMHSHEMSTVAFKQRRGGWGYLGKRIDFMDLPGDVRRFVAGEFMPEE